MMGAMAVVGYVIVGRKRSADKPAGLGDSALQCVHFFLICADGGNGALIRDEVWESGRLQLCHDNWPHWFNWNKHVRQRISWPYSARRSSHGCADLLRARPPMRFYWRRYGAAGVFYESKSKQNFCGH